MAAARSLDWLPTGCSVQFNYQKGCRRVTYINLETGKMFFSKGDVILYTERTTNCGEEPKPINIEFPLLKSHMHEAENTDECPDWLPDGWTVELRTYKSGVGVGRKYKCCFDPSRERTFYSKPEVFRHLRNAKPKRRKSRRSRSKVVVEKHDVEDLPPGWKLEIKARKGPNRIKKDPYYTDPVHGYIFSSKKEVLRYLHEVDTVKRESTCTEYMKLTADEVISVDPGKVILSGNDPASTPAANNLINDSHMYRMEKHNASIIQTYARKSKNKRNIKLPCRTSKGLARIDPELLVEAISSESALQNAAAESCKSEPLEAVHSAYEEAPPQSDADHENKVSHDSCATTSPSAVEESLNQIEKSFEDEAVPEEGPQKLETEKAAIENPVSQFDNDIFQDVQENLVTSHNLIDGTADFGSANLLQSDISPQFSEPEQSTSGRLIPADTSLASAENVSMSDCKGILGQQLSMSSCVSAGNLRTSRGSMVVSSQHLSVKSSFSPSVFAGLSNWSELGTHK